MVFKPHIYFLGIGGIGMSALARYFKKAGHKVAGYDRYASPLCRQLELEGMQIHYEDNIEKIPTAFRDPGQTLVIYTPAIPGQMQEKTHFMAAGFECYKRAEVLGFLSEKHRCYAVAGTHGKTTTSTMLAHILRAAEIPSLAFLGGIAANYNSNFWGNPGDPIMVVEADEYDRSFLKLKPHASVITSMEADHLDIYSSGEELRDAFLIFAHRTEALKVAAEATGLPFENYGWSETCTYHGHNIRIEEHRYVFDITGPDFNIANIRCPLPGKHNLENIMAATLMAAHAGATPGQIKVALESFRGIRRRFEYHLHTKKQVFIDDYAHHPGEIRALLHTVKELYPKWPITLIFQPHLYSRTRDFLKDFANSLSPVDHLILMPIYPAREKAIPGVDSERLAKLCTAPKVQVMEEAAILEEFKKLRPPLLLTVGAGDIDRIVAPLKNLLLKPRG